MPPYFIIDIPQINQTQIIFRAKPRGCSKQKRNQSEAAQEAIAAAPPPVLFKPGEETLETKLFDVDGMPRDEELAFGSIQLVLQKYAEDFDDGVYRCHHAVIHKHKGEKPNSKKFTVASYARSTLC